MAVYLWGGVASIILFAISEKIVKKRRWIFVLPALLIPCVIAGLRAETVGVDTEGYMVPMIKAALFSDNYVSYMSSKWYRIWKYLSVKNYEVGFSFIVYVFAKLFNSIFAVQFAIQALTVVPIYLAVCRTKYKTWICMSVYYFMFFNTSLNMIRQMVAVSFCLLAVQFFIEKKKAFFWLFAVIGFSFHYSSVLILIVVFSYKFVQKEKNRKILGLKLNPAYCNMILVMLTSILCLLSLNVIAQILPYIGLGKYVNYLMSSSSTLQFMPMQIVTRLPILILFIVNWKTMKKKENNLNFYFTMIFLDIVVAQLTSVNIYSGRLTVYFSIFGIFSYASLCSKAKYKYFTKVCVFAYLIFYWWYFYVFLGRDSTIPYAIMQL